jgi:hypothetical protein
MSQRFPPPANKYFFPPVPFSSKAEISLHPPFPAIPTLCPHLVVYQKYNNFSPAMSFLTHIVSPGKRFILLKLF